MTTSSLRHRVGRLAAGALLATTMGAVAVAVPQAAFAACQPPDGEKYLYTFTNVTTSTRPTNLYSAYIDGPATVSYNQTSTATVSASMTATVSAEAGIVFAKASASIGVTVGASYSWTDGFTYSKPVPAGTTARLRLYRESRSFNVTKKGWNTTTCWYTTTVYSNQFTNAPRSSDILVWKLEYK